jgi:hypothetical protein
MFNLEPDTLSDIPPFPEKHFEFVRAATETVDLHGDWTVPSKAVTVMRVKTGKFTVNVAINTTRMAQRLVATFHGARGVTKNAADTTRPMLVRRNWEALFECPILAISDPQTEADWNVNVPRCAFYMGTLQDDLVPELNALIDVFCAKLGIPVDNVVLYGSSAGGTSAILVGSQRKTRTGIIATCPFLRPDRYHEGVLNAGVRALGGTKEEFDRMMEDTPWRFDPMAALKDAHQNGQDIRLFVAQNLKDKSTILRHFPAVWRRFNIDPDGGLSPGGRVMTAMYDSAEAGHGHEPPEYSRPVWQEALKFFDAPVAERERKEVKKKGKSAVAAEE